jgi:transposase/IS5 family transposase
MAKYKKYDYSQMVMIPVSLENQLMPGTLEHTIHEVIEKKVDLSLFNEKYNNDETGAPAHDPKLLLKVVLLAFSRSMIGSRKIEKACQENITFMALSCGMAPDHSTIAHFISSMRDEIIQLYSDILLYCEELNLLGGSHFSLDGCKLPSNASKRWSGTFKELRHKRKKLEEKVGKILLENENTDKDSGDTDRKKSENKIKRMNKQIDQAKENMKAIGRDEDYFEDKILTADANYHTNKNIEKCEKERIDAYIPDTLYRKRDERFKEQDRFKDGVNKPAKKKAHPLKREIYSWEEFQYDRETGKYKCPNGKNLNQQSLKYKIGNKYYKYYRAKEADCRKCPLRSKCLARKNVKARALLIPLGYIENKEKQLTLSQKMKEKIDTDEGKVIYSKRLATVEPVFANIRSQKRLDRFTYRGKVKVNIQWMLYCMVHNIEKIMNYGFTG